MISARDITNRVLLEKEKSLSHAAIDNVGEAIYLLNKDAYVCRSNDFCCGLWGISREELTKTKIFKINKKLNKKNWLAFWESMMLKKETVNEAIHTISGNKKVQVEVKYNLFEFDNIKYILAIASDITERKKSEQRITKQLLEIKRLKDRLETENLYLKDEIKLNHNFNEIITKDNKLKKILQNVEKVASTDSSVLILGETGTGKELLARAIHDISKRRNKSLIKINCAALPANLLESELFGYEKGAFTGALSKRIGRFEIADKGTIFLDEIGELPMELQPKLLRVLQDGEFERLGSSKTIKVNVRIISASNRDLKKEISEKKFRPDLYYRLNVFPIYNPPLRDRKNDIPLLVNYFVNKFSKIHGKQIYRIT
ncbi:MAG: sigma 54-interacting transcriptional regulator, partial [Bacteroidota bacterium]|nr:sigma 54-interacting transcriptional regulator [Bacteroidota bacterium]